MKLIEKAAPIFRIKSYGRTELAQLYNPEVAPETAWRRLRAWIKKSPGMVERLLAAGYIRGQRVFTPKQVGIIVDGVGGAIAPNTSPQIGTKKVLYKTAKSFI